MEWMTSLKMMKNCKYMKEEELRNDIILLCKIINELLDDAEVLLDLDNTRAEKFLMDMQKKYNFDIHKV